MRLRHRVLFRLALVSASLSLITAAASAKSHVVAPGESLWALARQYGVSVEALQAANELGASSQIRAGQTLSIPASISANNTSPQRPATKAATSPTKKEGQVAAPSSTKKDPVTSRAEAPLQRAPSTIQETAPDWVLAAPGRLTQGEKPSAARGGIFPCAAPDPGFAQYAKWVQVAPMAHVLAPPAGSSSPMVNDGDGFDVLFHFHGREPIRKEWVRALQDGAYSPVLVGIDVGIASESYREVFRDARTFSQLLLAVESEIRRRSGNPRAYAQNVTLSAWSAGYGAVERLLTQPEPQRRVGSVILLDSLHAGFTDENLDEKRLVPFARFAEAAAKGQRFMFVSHSSIRTPGYASTTQTANYLTWKVGGQPTTTTPLPTDPMGLDRITTYSQGNYHVRGFRGSGASDHCAHLGLMTDVINVHLLPSWKATRENVAPPKVATIGNSSSNDASR